MSITTPINTDYLIDALRLHLGDTDSTAYRFLDEWLRVAVVQGIKSLQRWWNYRYLVDTDNNVYRNPHTEFLFPEPPTIQNGDEEAIILMAAIIINEGTLQNNAWLTGSWKDAEISYSNIEASRSRGDLLKGDWEKLTAILKVPQKRLANALKGDLPGFKNSTWEGTDKY